MNTTINNDNDNDNNNKTRDYTNNKTINNRKETELELDLGFEGIENVIELISDCKYLNAYNLLKNSNLLNKFINMNENDKNYNIKSIIDIAIERAEAIDIAIDEAADNSITTNWLDGGTMFGCHIFYNIDEKNLLTVRLEGILDDFPIFEQLCVIHEVDLFQEWVPFCNDSKLITKFSKAEVVAYLGLGLTLPFPISRDTLIHAWGADCLDEKGKIVIIGKSVNSVEEARNHSISEDNIASRPDEGNNIDPNDIKWKDNKSGNLIQDFTWKTGWFHDRMNITKFKFVMTPTSPTAAKTVILAQVDPKAPLPAILLNFIIRNIAGLLLYYFQQKVLSVSKDPNCSHNVRMIENKEFYIDWVYKKVERYCMKRGWPCPEPSCCKN